MAEILELTGRANDRAVESRATIRVNTAIVAKAMYSLKLGLKAAIGGSAIGGCEAAFMEAILVAAMVVFHRRLVAFRVSQTQMLLTCFVTMD